MSTELIFCSWSNLLQHLDGASESNAIPTGLAALAATVLVHLLADLGHDQLDASVLGNCLNQVPKPDTSALSASPLRNVLELLWGLGLRKVSWLEVFFNKIGNAHGGGISVQSAVSVETKKLPKLPASGTVSGKAKSPLGFMRPPGATM